MAVSAPPRRRTIRVVAAVVQKNERYLITQRRPNAVLPLLWEFPGGKVEEGETDVQALTREVEHRLGVEVEVGELISFVSHPYEPYTGDSPLSGGKRKSDELQPKMVNAFRWVTSSEFDRYPFTPADEASMTKL